MAPSRHCPKPSHVRAFKRRCRPSSPSNGSNDRRHPHQQRRGSPSPLPSSPDSTSLDASTQEASSSPRLTRRGQTCTSGLEEISTPPKVQGRRGHTTFLSFNGTYGNTDKVLNFIQQFDAAFGGDNLPKKSKLKHVAMYFQKSTRQWGATRRAQRLALRTWEECKVAIMKQFLTDEAKDEILMTWRSLKLVQGDTEVYN